MQCNEQDFIELLVLYVCIYNIVDAFFIFYFFIVLFGLTLGVSVL